MELESDYSESSSITFEWTLKGLKTLFDSTKGEKKSKVTKSIRFGENRWQVPIITDFAGEILKSWTRSCSTLMRGKLRMEWRVAL